MYIERSEGYLYIRGWHFVFYMKHRSKVSISFIEYKNGVMIGDWFVGFVAM